MIAVNHVTFRYETMLMEFDLAVPARAFMAIVGPSGAGKSTLLSLIAGFENPLGGSISVNGQSIDHLPPSARPLSMIFQDHNSFAHLDVLTNVALGITPRATLSGAQNEKVLGALERTGIAGLARRKPTEISGGERQRIAIARALVRDRPILLLDEPFTALGPALRQEMLSLILELQEERGLTVLMVTHQPSELRSAASHVAFLDQGHVMGVYSPRVFFSKNAPAAVRDYLTA
jgi:thiamine transport system ATP-binding protein